MRRAQKSDRRRVVKRAPTLKTAIATIVAYRKSLASLGARRDIIDSLDGAIKVLEENIDAQHELFSGVEQERVNRDTDLLGGQNPNALSAQGLWDIVSNEDVSRKTLERIATERFAVPRGSMRSFPSIPLLREKIMTLLRNEAAHRTIASVSQPTNTK